MRVFAAVPLPAATRARLRAITEPLSRGFPGLAVVGEAAMHVTIRFFGELDEGEVADLCARTRDFQSPVGAFPAVVGGLGQFPARGAPRVLYVAFREGRSEFWKLWEAFVSATAEVGREEAPEEFVAHVTLARCKRVRPAADDPVFVRFRGELERLAVGVTVDRLVLYRSILKPQGPEYQELQSLELP